MSEREYVVNFGDDRSSAFVRLAMAEATEHGANLREEIVRCRDCAFFSVWDASAIYGNHEHDVTFCIRWIDVMRMDVEPDGSCALGVRKESSDD